MRVGSKYILALLIITVGLPLSAQVDRRDVRAGNRKFRKENFKEAEIDFRKALVKDSTSVTALYNLASDLYRQEDYEGAQKAISSLDEMDSSPDYWFNKGDISLQKKDYKGAVDAFRQALLQTPDDLDAKENYIYARKMLENQQNQDQDQNRNQDQDQNQDQQDNQQNQDQDQQNQDQQNQDRNQDRDREGDQPSGQQISPRQAQQMLRVLQAKEKETQEKVNKEKAAALQSRQKEKNW